MKRTTLLLLLLVSILMAHATDELLVFKTNNFDGWVYNRSSVEINNSNISNDNITLYRDYSLTSPEVVAHNVKSITVNVTGRTKGVVEGGYSSTLGKVYVQLINDNDSVLREAKHTFATAELDRNFEVEFDITDFGDNPFRLRLACWDAEIASRFSVRKVLATVKEYISSGVLGDVNGDGIVTSADITALYDYLLNNDSSNVKNGDVNDDGEITAADITAVYTIMLTS